MASNKNKYGSEIIINTYIYNNNNYILWQQEYEGEYQPYTNGQQREGRKNSTKRNCRKSDERWRRHRASSGPFDSLLSLFRALFVCRLVFCNNKINQIEIKLKYKKKTIMV